LPDALVHAGQELALHRAAGPGADRRFAYASERFSARPGEPLWLEATIEPAGAGGAGPQALVELWRWRSADRGPDETGPPAVAQPKSDTTAGEAAASAAPRAP
jgi:hypothetical protein